VTSDTGRDASRDAGRRARRDQGRREVAARGVTPEAIAHLTQDALGTIGFEQLAPVKGLLKRFFSDAGWDGAADAELAALVGPGTGWWRYELTGGFGFEFGWRDGEFGLDVRPPLDQGPSLEPEGGSPVPVLDDELFAGSVVPEATPNPRTIRFVTGPIRAGASRWYESPASVDDARVARLFTEFDAIANVLVGPDFVAVGLRRPDQWEPLLRPILHMVETEFPPASPDAGSTAVASAAEAGDAVDVRGGGSGGRANALDTAWRELSGLRGDDPDDRARILAATSSTDAAVRQVAARVLIDADPNVARDAWSLLLDDASRTVRRATVDVMVDAERPELRPLLEHALLDADAWTRWKALRGLVELGADPSRDAITALTSDSDFRVRLEAARALRT
jgi:hypothetical protein